MCSGLYRKLVRHTHVSQPLTQGIGKMGSSSGIALIPIILALCNHDEYEIEQDLTRYIAQEEEVRYHVHAMSSI